MCTRHYLLEFLDRCRTLQLLSVLAFCLTSLTARSEDGGTREFRNSGVETSFIANAFSCSAEKMEEPPPERIAYAEVPRRVASLLKEQGYMTDTEGKALTAIESPFEVFRGANMQRLRSPVVGLGIGYWLVDIAAGAALRKASQAPKRELFGRGHLEARSFSLYEVLEGTPASPGLVRFEAREYGARTGWGLTQRTGLVYGRQGLDSIVIVETHDLGSMQCVARIRFPRSDAGITGLDEVRLCAETSSNTDDEKKNVRHVFYARRRTCSPR